ncbi:hypothetical protein Ae201684_002515 [Aphanomyces euteiches]|nr:hypothetical protein Ae201684_002515 [Aphanomyces euteiches]
MIAPRSVRPRVTNEYDDREIRREVMKNRRVSAETLQRSFLTLYDKEISLETFRRRIREWGLNGRVAIKKPFISKANRESVSNLPWSINCGLRMTGSVSFLQMKAHLICMARMGGSTFGVGLEKNTRMNVLRRHLKVGAIRSWCGGP